jgi:hypothetical protein
VSKFVGKFRHRDYILEDDDDYNPNKNYVKVKKRKSEDMELKRIRLQDERYGYDNYSSKKPRKFAKL